MPEGLKLVIGADVSDAEKKLKSIVSTAQASASDIVSTFSNLTIPLKNVKFSSLPSLPPIKTDIIVDTLSAVANLQKVVNPIESLKSEIGQLQAATGKPLFLNTGVVETQLKELVSGARVSATGVNSAFANLKIPLNNLNAYSEAINKLKSNVSSVKFAALPPLPQLKTEVRVDTQNAVNNLGKVVAPAILLENQLEQLQSVSNKPILVDTGSAQTDLKRMVTVAQSAGPAVEKAFSGSSLPLTNALQETSNVLKAVTPQIAALGVNTNLAGATASVNRLNDTIDELKAKTAAKQQILSTETDIAKISILNKEIQELTARITLLSNLPVVSTDVHIDSRAAISNLEKVGPSVKVLENQLLRLQQIAGKPLTIGQLSRVSGLIETVQRDLSSLTIPKGLQSEVRINISPAQTALKTISADAQSTVSKVSSVFSNLNIPIDNIQRYSDQITTLKKNLGSVTIKPLPPLPPLPKQDARIDTTQVTAALKAVAADAQTSALKVSSAFGNTPIPLQNITQYNDLINSLKKNIATVKFSPPPVTAPKGIADAINIDTNQARASLKNIAVDADKAASRVVAVFSSVVLPTTTIQNYSAAITALKQNINSVSFAKLTDIVVAPKIIVDKIPVSDINVNIQPALTSLNQLNPAIKSSESEILRLKQVAEQPLNTSGVNAFSASIGVLKNNLNDITKVAIPTFGNLNAPLNNLNQYNAAITALKQNLDTVKIAALPVLPSAKIIIGADVSGAQAGLKQIATDAQVAGDSIEAGLKGAFDQMAAQGILSIGSIENALQQFKQTLSVTTDPQDVARLNLVIDALKNKLNELKTTGGLGAILSNVKVPLNNINEYTEAINRLKQNIGSVKFAPIPPLPALKTEVVVNTHNAIRNIEGVLKPTEILQNQLLRLQRIAEQPLNFNQLQRVSGLLQKTERELSSLGKVNVNFNKFTKGTNEATGAMINLGRVVQDAPFGFLGIANNLNPLLESFQRLKATTGGTGSALKALVGSLGGAGGIGFALSIVSSGLIVFGDRLFGAGAKSKEAAEKIKAATEKLKELTRSISDIRDEAVAGTQDELAKVNALSNAVLNQTLSYKERNAALNQLKDINKGYFGDLTLEKAELGLLKTAVDDYTKAIIAAAVVKGFESEIGKVAPELAKQNKALNKAAEEARKYNEVLKNTKETTTSLTGETRLTQAFVNASKAAKGANKNYNDQVNIAGTLQRQMVDLKDGINGAVVEMLKFKPLDIKDPDKPKDNSKDIIAEAKRVAEFLRNETHFVVTYEFNPLDSKAAALAKAQSFLDDVAHGRLKLRFDVAVDITGPPIPQDIITDAQTELEKMSKVGILLPTKLEPPEPFDPSIIRAQDDWNDSVLAGILLAKKLAAEADFIASTVNSTLSPAFEGLFSAIQSGENPIKAFFHGLGQAVVQLIQKLVQAVAVAAILSAILPGGVGGAKGFGAIFGKLLGLQGGGLVSGPTLAAVGEGSGTSLSNPEVVAPLDKLKHLLNGIGSTQRVQVAISGSLRGRDIRLQNARTSRREGRLGIR